MARSASKSETDTSSVAQSRFTIQLPAEVRPDLDRISKAVSDAVAATTGVGVDLSMAQTVTALIKARAAELRAIEAESANGTEPAEAAAEA